MPPDICISVIIPAYNYAKLLPRAVASALEQREAGVEVVVVDDGSTDETPAVLDQLSRQWPELIVHRQANAGAAAARNRGVLLASGRYLLMLDADDELIPGSLAALKAAVNAHPDAALFQGGHVSVQQSGRERERAADSVPSKPVEELVRDYLLKKRISVSHGCSLFRRDILEACPYPEHLRSCEDIPVFARALITGPVVRLDQSIARIYKHPDSLRHQRRNEDSQAIVDAVFTALPESCEHLRQPYLAQRLLSLFRAESLTGDPARARELYLRALRIAPRQALKWTYLRKALRTLVRQAHG